MVINYNAYVLDLGLWRFIKIVANCIGIPISSVKNFIKKMFCCLRMEALSKLIFWFY